MSCFDCIHFRADRGKDYHYLDTGKCTFNPVWVEVRVGHYCGQLRMKSPDSLEATTTLQRTRERWESVHAREALLKENEKKLEGKKRLFAAERKLMNLADATKKDTP